MGSKKNKMDSKKLKRRYIGIEKDEDIFKIAVERVKNIYGENNE